MKPQSLTRELKIEESTEVSNLSGEDVQPKEQLGVKENATFANMPRVKLSESFQWNRKDQAAAHGNVSMHILHSTLCGEDPHSPDNAVLSGNGLFMTVNHLLLLAGFSMIIDGAKSLLVGTKRTVIATATFKEDLLAQSDGNGLHNASPPVSAHGHWMLEAEDATEEDVTFINIPTGHAFNAMNSVSKTSDLSGLSQNFVPVELVFRKCDDGTGYSVDMVLSTDIEIEVTGDCDETMIEIIVTNQNPSDLTSLRYIVYLVDSW